VAETATTALEQAARGAGQGLSQAARGAQAVGAAQAGIQAGANAAAGSLGQAGNAAKLTAFQAQQLGFQLNDLFVQIASGQSPVTALVQQGSQLSGTFGGLRGTFAALATVFTPVRLLIGGAATVVAGLALAFEKGRGQSQEFQRSLILTGNAAGITEDKFNSLAQAIARSTNTTIGSTRETLQGLVSSGRFSGAALEQAATAAQLMSKVTGQSGDDILKSFVSAADGIGKFAEYKARTLSYGDQRRLEIARALAGRPKLLILDEPAAGLNDSETLELARFIEQLRAEGLTILLVEHDMGLVMRVCSRVIVLAFGKKIADAEPAVVRHDPHVLDAYLGTGDDE